MRRVAVISDVHGNLPALEAVLEEIEGLEVDLVVFAGDVGFGPEPERCIERLHALGDLLRLVRGNCDREEDLIPDAAATVGLDVEGLGSVLVCHATPRSDVEVVTVLTPEDELAEAVAGAGAGVVVCGHTHMQYDRSAGGTRVVCAGSVGRPYEGRPGAFWVLLGPDVEHRRTGYDVEAAVTAAERSGWAGAEDLVATLREPPKPEDVAREFEGSR